MAIEQTLILLKPDAIKQNLVGEVLGRFLEGGNCIRGIKMMQLDPPLLEEHYAHIADRPFYPNLVEFMTSTPVIAVALEGVDVIAQVRSRLGATDSPNADLGTIRRDHGTNSMFNICHASDSPESAAIELKRFFQDSELYSFDLNQVNF